jgi:DNA-directed RNA polymerase subunit RPC12/RpoP
VESEKVVETFPIDSHPAAEPLGKSSNDDQDPAESCNNDDTDPEYDPEESENSSEYDESESDFSLQPEANALISMTTEEEDNIKETATTEEGVKRAKRSKSAVHKCSICHQIFQGRWAKQSLDRHLHTHSGLRNFSCPHCPAKFIQKRHCLRHIKNIHLKLNSFACQYCDRKFVDSYGKNIHEKVVEEFVIPPGH